LFFVGSMHSVAVEAFRRAAGCLERTMPPAVAEGIVTNCWCVVEVPGIEPGSEQALRVLLRA